MHRIHSCLNNTRNIMRNTVVFKIRKFVKSDCLYSECTAIDVSTQIFVKIENGSRSKTPYDLRNDNRCKNSARHVYRHYRPSPFVRVLFRIDNRNRFTQTRETPVCCNNLRSI